jgi:hypothetical protein
VAAMDKSAIQRAAITSKMKYVLDNGENVVFTSVLKNPIEKSNPKNKMGKLEKASIGKNKFNT